jgi:hypothetical protein
MEKIAQSFQEMSAGDFAALGAQSIAYVKAIALQEGQVAFGVFAADGRPLATVPSLEIAQALLRQNDLEAALVH